MMVTANSRLERLTPTSLERLTPAEIAHELRQHPSAVIRWLTSGTALRDGSRLRLYGTRLPRGWIVARADLEAFLEELTKDRFQASDPPIPRRPRPRISPRLRVKAARADQALKEEGF
jgi:hypothetical protein